MAKLVRIFVRDETAIVNGEQPAKICKGVQILLCVCGI